MKLNFLRRHSFVLVLASMTLCLHLLAQSTGQPSSRPTGPTAAGAPAARMGGPGSGAGLDVRILSVLTPEQKASLQSAVQARRSQTTQLEQRLRTARKELAEVGFNGKVDENDIRQKAKAVGDAEAELAIARAKALSEIKPPLSEEQVQKMRSPLRFTPRNASMLQKEQTGGSRLLSSSPTNTASTNKAH